MLLCKPIATAVIEGTYYGDAQRDVEARQRARLEERSRMTALIRRNKKVVSYFSTLMAENKQQSQAAAQTAAQNSKSQHNSPAVRTPRNLDAVGDLRLMSRPPAPPPPPPRDSQLRPAVAESPRKQSGVPLVFAPAAPARESPVRPNSAAIDVSRSGLCWDKQRHCTPRDTSLEDRDQRISVVGVRNLKQVA
jgi:hypothetical protein